MLGWAWGGRVVGWVVGVLARGAGRGRGVGARRLAVEVMVVGGGSGWVGVGVGGWCCSWVWRLRRVRAIGRVVEAVSHSPYWDDTAIFIVEDDAQDGADPVDAHRSMALDISIYARGNREKPHV